MAAHITYRSEIELEERFGRARQPRRDGRPGEEWAVEGYLRHQGRKLVARFDANTYLLLSRTMDDFDAFADDAAVDRAVAAGDTRWCLVSFTTDRRFGTAHSLRIAERLRAAGADVEHTEVASRYGHDSFLLEIPAYHDVVRRFLS
jgi:homoserine O-acetyltransferase/O-succinyltransferase